MSLSQTYLGRAPYRPDLWLDQHLLFVAIACVVGGRLVDTLVDTGSQWCVLPPTIARDIGYEARLGEAGAQLLTRFGTVSGELVRIPVRFRDEEGRDLEIEATWFISDDWLGPPVIGWKGCLERIRFALDPTDESFYFAEL